MPLSVVTAKNTYPRVESYTQTLADYDREVTEYYDLRSGSRLESFTTWSPPTSAWAARTSPPSWRSSTNRGSACADPFFVDEAVASPRAVVTCADRGATASSHTRVSPRLEWAHG